MAIVNRTLDNSEKKEVFTLNAPGVVATGTTKYVFSAPFPCVVQSINYAAQGVSNSCQLITQKAYFVAGAGLTTVAMGISNIVLADFSVSGMISFSGLQAQGHTNLYLNAGDVVNFKATGTNGAYADLTINVVVQKLQDIVTYNGV